MVHRPYSAVACIPLAKRYQHHPPLIPYVYIPPSTACSPVCRIHSPQPLSRHGYPSIARGRSIITIRSHQCPIHSRLCEKSYFLPAVELIIHLVTSAECTSDQVYCPIGPAARIQHVYGLQGLYTRIYAKYRPAAHIGAAGLYLACICLCRPI